jgi:hypothetical protein
MEALDFEKLTSSDTKVKYGFVNELLSMGREHPQDLYPYLPHIVALLDSGNNILQWTGLDLLGLLIAVDTDHRIRPLLTRLYRYLNTGKMITTNHTVWALFEIAKVESDDQNEILGEILKTQEYRYDTEECKNIVYGNIIKGASAIYPNIKDESTKKKFYDFIGRQTANSRNATKKKAEAFIKKYDEQGGSR